MSRMDFFHFKKVQFYLEMIKIPSNIQSIEVNEWSDKNIFNRIPQAIDWSRSRYHMKLLICKNCNKIHFSCLFDIINIIKLPIHINDNDNNKRITTSR